LENFISTEAGTALCNRVAGSGSRQGPGCQDCGAPTAKTETQIVRFRDHTKKKYDVLAVGNEACTEVSEDYSEEEKVIGELMLKGDSVAQKYWLGGKEVKIDVNDGWFSTGDIIQYNKGCYKVWGRLNMDNINHKRNLVNATTIEKKVLSNKDIDDCYIVGVGDIQCEQQIAAIIVLNRNRSVSLESILEWCNSNMDESEVPTLFKIVDDIARDNSGHVDKLKIKNLFNDDPVLCFHDSKM